MKMNIEVHELRSQINQAKVRPDPTLEGVELAWPVVARRALFLAAGASLVILVVWSAILAKTARYAVPLAGIRLEALDTAPKLAVTTPPITFQSQMTSTEDSSDNETTQIIPADGNTDTRWFNGRPVRPAKSMWMTVTAYSPDAISCGTSADGITATLHSVETNAHRLVAADPTILTYGSMLSIEGYDRGNIVPVLDCGGAIKGHRLDVLFPTHQQAIKWGVRKIKVIVWEYADGKPPENPRHVR